MSSLNYTEDFAEIDFLLTEIRYHTPSQLNHDSLNRLEKSHYVDLLEISLQDCRTDSLITPRTNEGDGKVDEGFGLERAADNSWIVICQTPLQLYDQEKVPAGLYVSREVNIWPLPLEYFHMDPIKVSTQRWPYKSRISCAQGSNTESNDCQADINV